MDDQELNRLLREWAAPEAPASLRPRPGRGHRLRRWLTTTIRVPASLAAVALLLVAWWGTSTWPGPLARQTPRDAPEAAAPRRSGEVARFALTGPLQGFDAVIVELNFRPGVATQAHRHPGPTVGYVVDGQVRTALNDEPHQVVSAGGTFFEPIGALHTAFGSASPDAPARAVAFLIVPTGSPLTNTATTRTQP